MTSVSAVVTLIGLTGDLLARHWSIPPLITAVADITPLLPETAIYRDMHALLHDHLTKGFTALTSVLGIATALTTGIVLDEWVARKLRHLCALREDSGLIRPIRAGMRRIRPVSPRNKPRRPRNYRSKGDMNPHVDWSLRGLVAA